MSKHKKFRDFEERSQESTLDALYALEQGEISYEEFMGHAEVPDGADDLDSVLMAKIKEKESDKKEKKEKPYVPEVHQVNSVSKFKSKALHTQPNDLLSNQGSLVKGLDKVYTSKGREEDPDDDYGDEESSYIEKLLEGEDLSVSEDDIDNYDDDDSYMNITEDDAKRLAEASVEDEEKDKEEKKVNKPMNIRTIKTKYDKDLKKFTIDDGISPSTISVEAAISRSLNGTYSNEDASDRIEQLHTYMLTLLHPTAIFTVDEYRNNDVFKNLGYIDNISFMLYHKGNYVFAYACDDGYWDLERSLEVEGYSADDRLRVFIELVLEVGRVNNAFCSDDEDYVQAFMANHNQKEEFIQLIKDHPETDFVDDENDDVVAPYNMDEIQRYVRQLLSYLRDGIITKEDMDELDAELEEQAKEFYGDDEDDDDDDEDDDDYDDDVEDDTSVEVVDDPENIQLDVDASASEEDYKTGVDVMSPSKPADSLDVL